MNGSEWDDFSQFSHGDSFDSDFSHEAEEDEERFDFYDEPDLGNQEEEFQNSFKNMLVRWIFDFYITKSAVTALLCILNSVLVLRFLPRTYRTLLKTPRKVNLEIMNPGKYFHLGLPEGLAESLELDQINPSTIREVGIFVNVDGVPVSKSSRSDFWPILGRICSPFSGRPFEIGVYHGVGKPDNFNSFLKRFVDEANHLITNGFYFKGKKILFKIVAFTCDLPALASVKFIKSHSGHFGCTKCVTKGTYIRNEGNKNGGRVTFPEVSAQLRTDRSFRNQSQKEHHSGRSILETLPISMVGSFTVDPMHNAFIGLTRKLLNVWNNGRKLMTVSLFLNYFKFLIKPIECLIISNF